MPCSVMFDFAKYNCHFVSVRAGVLYARKLNPPTNRLNAARKFRPKKKIITISVGFCETHNENQYIRIYNNTY